MHHLGLDREGLEPRLARGALRHHVGQPQLAAQRALDRIGDAHRAARLVLVVLELARHRDGVEREPVGRGEDLRVDDVGAGRRAGAGDDRQQPRMVGREHGQLGDAARGVEADAGRDRLAGGSARDLRKCACETLCGRSTLSQ